MSEDTITLILKLRNVFKDELAEDVPFCYKMVSFRNIMIIAFMLEEMRHKTKKCLQ